MMVLGFMRRRKKKARQDKNSPAADDTPRGFGRRAEAPRLERPETLHLAAESGARRAFRSVSPPLPE